MAARRPRTLHLAGAVQLDGDRVLSWHRELLSAVTNITFKDKVMEKEFSKFTSNDIQFVHNPETYIT